MLRGMANALSYLAALLNQPNWSPAPRKLEPGLRLGLFFIGGFLRDNRGLAHTDAKHIFHADVFAFFAEDGDGSRV